MPILVVCPHCGRNAHFADNDAGLAISCLGCRKTLHVDDTLSYLPVPGLRRLMLHPALGDVLQRRKGAAQEFRGWAAELVERCATVQHICTAHMRLPPPGQFPSIAAEVRKAVQRVEKKLARHEQSFG